MTTSPEVTSFSSFLDYKRVVLTLATDLQKLREFAQRLKLEHTIAPLDDVLERITNDSFKIAVVGEFKRGKSTFINALLGKAILPADILPCSATLNRITYNVMPLVKIAYKDGHCEEVPIDRLTDFVTKLTPESEQLAETVKEAIVYYPVNYCKNNVDIFDTPGLNDDQTMTDVTLSVLPTVDAAILVILAQSPLSEYERDFLENKLLVNDLGRVIFVVTGIDRMDSDEDTTRLLKSIETRILNYVLARAEKNYGKDSEEYAVYRKKIGKPRVFGISAKQALAAKASGDVELLRRSHFAEFETALEKFLTEDRGAVFLQVPVNRLLAAAGEILSTINLQENALCMKRDEFEAAHAKSVAELDTLRKQKTEELTRIDEAAECARQRIHPLVEEMRAEILHAAAAVIDRAEITADEVSKNKGTELQERLAKQISTAVRNVGQTAAERIQTEIQRELSLEADRLQGFSDQIAGTLAGIHETFNMHPQQHENLPGETAAAVIATYTGLGGIWSGYRLAGAKGAAVGAVGSFGTAVGAGLVCSLIGLPVTFPIVLAIGVVSIFTGGWLTKKVFGGSMVEDFRTKFKASVSEEITKQLAGSGIEQRVSEQITLAFSCLKTKVQQEVDALLDNTQATLAELRGKQERNETLTESEQQEMQAMRTDTQAILGNAQRISRQLVEILEIV